MLEKSESGAPIFRYDENQVNPLEPATGDSFDEAISDHIEKYVGHAETVLHELVSTHVHIDVYWIKPTEEKPYHTLVTSGMSNKPMNAPEDLKGYADYAELCISLLANWKFDQESMKDDTNYWPVRWLKYLARFPHVFNTWLSYGHTIPNGDPAEPFAENTECNTMLLLPSILHPEEFQQLEVNGKKINFFALYPLYEEEVNIKLRYGLEGLFDGFEKHRVSDLLRLDRPNTAL